MPLARLVRPVLLVPKARKDSKESSGIRGSPALSVLLVSKARKDSRVWLETSESLARPVQPASKDRKDSRGTSESLVRPVQQGSLVRKDSKDSRVQSEQSVLPVLKARKESTGRTGLPVQSDLKVRKDSKANQDRKRQAYSFHWKGLLPFPVQLMGAELLVLSSQQFPHQLPDPFVYDATPLPFRREYLVEYSVAS